MDTRRTFRRLALVALLLLTAPLLAGCSVDNPFSDDSPSEPDASLVIGGLCRADSVGFNRQVVCEDTSQTEPAGHLDSITFILQSASTGLTIETRVITNAQNVPLPRTINFTGIQAGTYQVEHVVKSDRGREVRRTYRNISV